jgi:hypothetical protein
MWATLLIEANKVYNEMVDWHSLTDPSLTPAEGLLKCGVKKEHILPLRREAKNQVWARGEILIDLWRIPHLRNAY